MKGLFVVGVAAALWFVPGDASACGCCDHHDHHAARRSAAGTAQLGPGEARVKIPITGMHCGHCVSRVEAALAKVKGVRLADASLQDGEAVIVFEKTKINAPKLVETIDALGFKAGAPTQE